MGDYMKKIYGITDQEILKELFSGMTQSDIDAWVEKMYTQSHFLTPDILRNGGLI